MPYRVRRDGTVEVRLITSRETRRWVLPKGWPMKGMTPAKAAARETYEEAGLLGAVARKPIGLYTYEKRLANRSIPCDVMVFPLKVKHQVRNWPERSQRFGFWFSIESAAAAVQEEELKELILAFGAFMAQKAEAKRKAGSPKAASAKAKAEQAEPAPEAAEASPPATSKPEKVKAAKPKPSKGKPTKAALVAPQAQEPATLDGAAAEVGSGMSEAPQPVPAADGGAKGKAKRAKPTAERSRTKSAKAKSDGAKRPERRVEEPNGADADDAGTKSTGAESLEAKRTAKKGAAKKAVAKAAAGKNSKNGKAPAPDDEDEPGSARSSGASASPHAAEKAPSA